MGLRVNTNIASLTAQRNLGVVSSRLQGNFSRLASGLRISVAADDAAGLAISERMRSQIRSYAVAGRNALDGVSLAQTAEGALNEVSSMMQRMRELAVQSANGTNSSSDRANLDAEYQALDTEIERLAISTNFNGLAIIDTDAGDQIFQIGANKGDTLKISTVALSKVGGDITNVANSEAALDAIDAAIDVVASDRADYGAASSRFSSAIKNLQIMSENTNAARGRIMDADFAVETANMTRATIMQQAGTAMVAQANQIPNGVLSLLG